MSRHQYAPPLDSLLTLGRPRQEERPSWVDPASLGLSHEHVGDLLKMVSDGRLHRDFEPVCWAPVHAWRAVAQLDPGALIEPFIKLLDRLDHWHDDFGLEEAPVLLAHTGTMCLGPVGKLIRDQRRSLWARVAGVQTLKELGPLHPETHGEILELVTRQLDLAPYNDPILNAFLVGVILDLRLHEGRTAIENAYLSGFVDESVLGSLDEVLEEMSMTKEASRELTRKRLDEEEKNLDMRVLLTRLAALTDR